ncbi:acyltransferase family protein [Akkermansia sp.]|uniref:acyltransferase family protein n=1 Tax=Akkermansia sp. TaxID=1872421 RepID=UPI0039950C8E
MLDFDYTNCLRGVAILLIMIGHIAGTMGIRWFTPFGGIGVALFLFLSGYGCNESYKYKGLSGFWWKKAKRVLLPYATVITLVFVYKQKWNWNSYLLSIIGLRTSFWFIAFMMKWYIVFWVTMKFQTWHRMLIMFLCSFLMLTLLSKIESEQAFSFCWMRSVPRRFYA